MICRMRSHMACSGARKEEKNNWKSMWKRSNIGESSLSIRATTRSIPHEELESKGIILESKGIIMERQKTLNTRVSPKVMVGSESLLQRRGV